MTWEHLFPIALVLAALLLQLGRVFTRPVEKAEDSGTNETGASALSESMKRPLRTQQSGSTKSKKPSGGSAIDAGAYAMKRHPLLLTLGSQEARRGIVLMTILGPCRAFDLPNPKD